MESWTFWDWLGYMGIAIAAIMIAADTAIAQSEQLSKYLPRLLKGSIAFVPLMSVLIGTSAFAYQGFHPVGALDLPQDAKEGSPFSLVQAWGEDNGVFYVVVKPSNRLLKDAGLHRIFLIVRAQYANVDPMTDKAIAKSQPYTIVNGFMTLAIPGTSMTSVRVVLDIPTQIEFDVVELPSMFSPEQITTLSDVTNMAGKILARTTLGTEFSRVVATDPHAACPPVPVRPGLPAVN